MNFTLQRFCYKKEGVFGRLLDEESKVRFYTLEHAYEQPDETYAPKLLAGSYLCTRYLSPKRGYEVWLVNEDSPKYDMIEIHIGNYNQDSDGCILVGERFEGAMVSSSRAAFETLRMLQMAVQSFTLTVEDSPNKMVE